MTSRLSRIAASALLPGACLLIVAYFAYFGLYGHNGLLSLVRVTHELELKAAELADVRAERAQLERRVLNMRPERLDPDLLDELARRTLGYTAPGEITDIEGADRP